MSYILLNDDWEVTGNDLNTFKEELKELQKRTFVKEVPMNNVYFLSVSDFGDEYVAVPLHSDEFWKKTKTSLSLKKYPIDRMDNAYLDRGYSESVVNDAFANGLFMAVSDKKISSYKLRKMIENGEYIPVSEKAMNTISSRISHGGFGFFSERLVRDLSISKKFNKPVPVTIVSRKDADGLEKIFAVMSKKYVMIPQELIVEVLDHIIADSKKDLGEPTVSSWSISHSVTRISIEFPEAGSDLKETYELPDDIIPGIMLETSDIGDCSLRIKGYYRIPDCHTIFYMPEEYSRIHVGEIDTEEILNAAKKEIFPKFTYYPEHLAELMAIDITTDDMTDNKKIKVMSALYRKISREIGLAKAIRKNREKILIDQLIETINPIINYTAYDVAITFLTLASYLDTPNKSVIEMIAKTVPGVMKFDFGQPKEETEDLLLVS